MIVLFLFTFFIISASSDNPDYDQYFSSLNQYYNNSNNPPKIDNNPHVHNSSANNNSSDDYVPEKLCKPGELKDMTKEEIEKHLEKIAKTFVNNAHWITHLNNIATRQEKEINTLKGEQNWLLHLLHVQEDKINRLTAILDRNNIR